MRGRHGSLSFFGTDFGSEVVAQNGEEVPWLTMSYFAPILPRVLLVVKERNFRGAPGDRVESHAARE